MCQKIITMNIKYVTYFLFLGLVWKRVLNSKKDLYRSRDIGMLYRYCVKLLRLIVHLFNGNLFFGISFALGAWHHCNAAMLPCIDALMH